MMNSDDIKVEAIIGELLALLGDEYIYDCIVKPIEKVRLDFDFIQNGQVTYNSFIETIGRFVQNVFKFGLRAKQDLSEEQARSIAYTLLETGYVGRKSRGYDAAYLDAIDLEIEGFELVLSHMTDIIISIESAKHKNWVVQSRLGHLNWQMKSRIAEAILERMYPYLPEELAGCNPIFLSDHLEDLLNLFVTSQKAVNKLLLEGTG